MYENHLSCIIIMCIVIRRFLACRTIGRVIRSRARTGCSKCACKDCPFTAMHCDTQLLGVNTMHADMYAMEESQIGCSRGRAKRAPLLVISLRYHFNPKTYNVIGIVIFSYRGD